MSHSQRMAEKAYYIWWNTHALWGPYRTDDSNFTPYSYLTERTMSLYNAGLFSENIYTVKIQYTGETNEIYVNLAVYK